MLSRRSMIRSGVGLGVCNVIAPFAHAQSSLIFAVNEGVTYKAGAVPMPDRYANVVKQLSQALGRNVQAVGVGNYRELSAGLAKGEYDMAYVHPAHHALAGLAGAYELIATTKGFQDYKVSFMVKSGSKAPARLQDAKGLSIAMPDADSISAVLARATLKEALGADYASLRIQYTRYQDAIPFMMDNGFAMIGATASNAVVNDWVKAGNQVMTKTQGIPIKILMGHKDKLLAPQRAAINAIFTGLSADDCKPLNVGGFVPYETKALLAMRNFLNKGLISA